MRQVYCHTCSFFSICLCKSFVFFRHTSYATGLLLQAPTEYLSTAILPKFVQFHGTQHNFIQFKKASKRVAQFINCIIIVQCRCVIVEYENEWKRLKIHIWWEGQKRYWNAECGEWSINLRPNFIQHGWKITCVCVLVCSRYLPLYRRHRRRRRLQPYKVPLFKEQ